MMNELYVMVEVLSIIFMINFYFVKENRERQIISFIVGVLQIIACSCSMIEQNMPEAIMNIFCIVIWSYILAKQTIICIKKKEEEE